MQFRLPFTKKKPGIKNDIVTLLQGLSLGTAEIIPGVSGSTVALLFGIYDDFIELLYQGSELAKLLFLFVIGKSSIKSIKEQIESIRWRWGIILGIGMVTAIIALSSVITMLLIDLPHYLFAFLLGLTPPTMYVVYGQIKRPRPILAVIGVITFTILMSLILAGEGSTSARDPHPLHLFVGGMISISAMVLPGVSGSFMLLVLGLYNFAVSLVAKAATGLSSAELTSLGVLLAGMATGFLTTVRVVRYAFKHYRDELMAFLLGLLGVSWYVLWPFVKSLTSLDHDVELIKVHPLAFDMPTIITILLIAAITAIGVFKLHTWADTQDRQSPKDDSGFDKL